MRVVLTFLLGSLLTVTAFGQIKDSTENYLPGGAIEAFSIRSNIVSRAIEPPPAGSSISGQIEFDAAKVEDLAAFGKVWGFLKYHHPVVTSWNYNWDLEMFRLLPEILAAQSKLERNEILSRWIDGLGSYQIGPVTVAGPVKLDPDTSWIDSRVFGVKLSKKLALIKNATRVNQNRYIRMAPNVGNPIFQNEDPYPTLTYPDLGYRLLALYRYWSIIHYYSPNRHVMGEDWDAVMTEYVQRFANAQNEFEYKMTAWSLIGRIHDTHANIWNSDPVLVPYRGVNAAPIRVKFIEEKLVVTGYWNKQGQQTGLLRGDVIETINGQTVQDYVNEHLEYTPASNYPTQLRDIANFILRTNATTLGITYRRNGVVSSLTLPAAPRGTVIDPNSIYWDPAKPPFEMIGKNKDIAYIFCGTLQPDQTISLIPQIASSRGLVIDMRTYPNDSSFLFEMANLLVPGPTSFAFVSIGHITTPGLFTMRDSFQIGTGGTHYAGKVVILINETTQSSAEFHTMAFRRTPGSVVIGSTTAGADGNVSEFFLPGGIRTWISGIGIYYPDGTETQRVGIIPDIVSKPTIQGFKEGRDEVLEKGIEVINAN